MTIFFWIVDLIIPVTMIVLGLVFKYKPPKKINWVYGYRTTRSMKSQKAWDYAHNRMGVLWLKIGSVLLIAYICSKLFMPITKEYLSLIHAGIGIIALFIGVPFVEKDLKVNFDKNPNSK